MAKKALGAILPQIDERAQWTIVSFIETLLPEKNIAVSFRESDPDIDGNPRVKIEAHWEE